MASATTHAETYEKESFAALLDASLGTSSSLEGTVIKGHVIGIENDMVLIDVGLKSEGRDPPQGILQCRPAGRHSSRRRSSSRCYVERYGRQATAKPMLSAARRLAAKRLGPSSRSSFHRQRPRQRHHLRPRQGRLHGRPQRRRGVPAGQPGRYPPRARHHPADRHAAALPDPEDGPFARQHRGLASRRARREPRRAAFGAGGQPQGRPDPQRRGQEHHRLWCVRRSRRLSMACCMSPTSPGAASTTRRKRCISARASRCRSSASTPRRSASRSV